MATQWFADYSTDDLVAERNKLEAEYLTAKRRIAIGTGSATTSMELQSLEERLAMIKMVLYQKDPTSFPEYAYLGATQTRVCFS